jgi:hypothetical protein
MKIESAERRAKLGFKNMDQQEKFNAIHDEDDDEQ